MRPFARTSLSVRRRSPRPLDCRDVGRVLQSYLDRESDPSLDFELAAHLEACRHCGLDAEVYRRIKAGLGHVGVSLLDPEVVVRLRHFGDSLVHPGSGDTTPG